MTLSRATRLGSYEIVEPIGAGAMGEVYRARDTKLSRDVAIKVLPRELAAQTERLARFEREACTASALSHPNIVTIYEVGSENGTSFIAMELVVGKTIRELVSGGPLPLRKVLAVAAQAADGLAKAHAAGIVHRDLKPENLMVTRDGFVKILDFGLAKLRPVDFERSHGAEQATVTRGTEAGTVLGTVGYMSPEQACGEPADFRSDQFSLGAILYEMLTGNRAFDRPTSAQTLSAIIEAEPVPLLQAVPKAPMSLAWVVERCLAKDPEDRYGSTKDLARDLAALRDHASASSASGVLPPERRRVRLSRIGLAAAALAVAGLAALTFVAGERVQARRDRNAPPPRRTTMTFRKGFLTGARFAPDGQTIVYSAAWDGKPSEIFTTRVGSAESRSLGIEVAGLQAVSSKGELAVTLDCMQAVDPCFGVLTLVPLAGGAPREALAGVSSADYSPDGQQLAVIHGQRLEYPIGKVLHETKTGMSSVRVSPGGDLVAFLEQDRRLSSRGALSVVDRAGKKRVLTGEWANLRPILWSPTGEEIFFSRWGSDEVRGATLSGRTRSASWLPGLDDVSREGLFLDTGRFENFRRVIRARVPDEPSERDLSWQSRSVAADLTRDGRRLLLYDDSLHSRNPDGEVFRTYLRSTDGSDAVLLGEGRALALSPDEAWALVTRESPEPHLVLLPAGADEPRRLRGAPGVLHHRRAVFFPDGKRILFVAETNDGAARSYIQDLAGGDPKPFRDDGSVAILVSPEGREVAGATKAVVPAVFSADGTGASRPIRGAIPWEPFIQWSADGKSIYFRDVEDRRMLLYRVDLATGRHERWKELAPPDPAGLSRYMGGMWGVRVTPDGRFYAYTYSTDSSRLVLGEAGPNWWR